MMTRVGGTVFEEVLHAIRTWSERNKDIIASALIGSWARGTPRDDSDIDFILLAENHESYRESTEWLQGIEWPATLSQWTDVSYGMVWSRHCKLINGVEVELAFSSPDWACLDPLDKGTEDVLKGGCRIVYDPSGLLEQARRRVGRSIP